MKKRQGQKGFTLIELMIVVAVIGVLSAIAIPKYQDYVHKGELGAGLATASALKINVEDYLASNGAFPTGGAGQAPADLGASIFSNGGITFANAANTAGSIVVTFTSGIASGETIQVNRDGNGTWTCAASAGSANVKPKGCN